jgi:hypothetical protein
MNVVKFKGAARLKQERSSTLSTFTGQRLDWERCLRFDRRISPLDYEIGCTVASHASARTGCAYVGADTIADEVGCARRQVFRSVGRLRAAGWLSWKRTGDANIYRIEFGQVDRTLDLFIAAREARKELRKKRGRNRFRDVPPESHLACADVPPESHLDVPPESHNLLSKNSIKSKGLPREDSPREDSLNGTRGIAAVDELRGRP